MVHVNDVRLLADSQTFLYVYVYLVTQPGHPSVDRCNQYCWRWSRSSLGKKQRVLRNSIGPVIPGLLAYWFSRLNLKALANLIGLTLAGSKRHKGGDELPRHGPCCLCEIFFLFYHIVTASLHCCFIAHRRRRSWSDRGWTGRWAGSRWQAGVRRCVLPQDFTHDGGGGAVYKATWAAVSWHRRRFVEEQRSVVDVQTTSLPPCWSTRYRLVLSRSV